MAFLLWPGVFRCRPLALTCRRQAITGLNLNQTPTGCFRTTPPAGTWLWDVANALSLDLRVLVKLNIATIGALADQRMSI